MGRMHSKASTELPLDVLAAGTSSSCHILTKGLADAHTWGRVRPCGGLALLTACAEINSNRMCWSAYPHLCATRRMQRPGTTISVLTLSFTVLQGKGMSSSALPYKRSAPSWLKTTPTEVIDQMTKLAKKGLTPSAIGVILRDQHGISQVRCAFAAWLASFGG